MTESNQGSLHGSIPENEPHPTSSQSTTPPPEWQATMATMKEALTILLAKVANIEAKATKPLPKTPPIPLASHFQMGGPSSQNQSKPLPPQEALFPPRKNQSHDTLRRPMRQEKTQGPSLPPIQTQRAISEHHSPYMNRYDDEFFYDMHDDRYMGHGWGNGRPWFNMPRTREQEDVIDKVMVKLPSFEGKCDPNLYMEWKQKMEQVWTCHNFLELKKVQLAALEFQHFAMIWWDNIVKEMRHHGEQQVSTWMEMKVLMRARFIPANHSTELLQRLENLKKGTMSVEEAYNAMLMALMKANVREDDNKTCARYLRVLNSNISMEVDIYPYSSSIELLHNSIKVERKFKNKALQNTRQGPSTITWRGGNGVPNQTVANKKSGTKEPTRPPFQSSSRPQGPSFRNKWSTPNPTPFNYASNTRTSTIECFKCKGKGHYIKDCLDKRTMVINSLGQYDFESDNE